MQIQIISNYDEMQSAFNQMMKDAINLLPVKELPQEPNIITGEILSEKLSVTIQTIIRWKAKGKIPYLQIGSAVRYDLNAVIEALTVGKKKNRNIYM